MKTDIEDLNNSISFLERNIDHKKMVRKLELEPEFLPDQKFRVPKDEWCSNICYKSLFEFYKMICQREKSKN